MKIIGIGIKSGELTMLEKIFTSAYRKLPDHWKRGIYDQTAIVVSRHSKSRFSEKKLLRGLLQQYPQYQFIGLQRITHSDTIDFASEAAMAMVVYLSILIEKDAGAHDAFIQSYPQFAHMHQDFKQSFLEQVSLWLLDSDESRDVLGSFMCSVCENIDRLLRGTFTKRIAHGLLVI